MRDDTDGMFVAKTPGMKIWRIGLLGFVIVIVAACSSTPADEQTEDGWGELQSGRPMDSQYALESDVSTDDLAIDDPVLDEDTQMLGDLDLEQSGDDAPDILVDDTDPKKAPIDRTELPTQLDLTVAGCTTTGPHTQYAKGAQLVTTDWLNLRTGPSIANKRITTMKPGMAVAVIDKTCGHAWAHIKDANGDVGWSSVQWLRAKQKAPPPSGWASFYSAARGQKLASKSWSMWKNSQSHGFCLRGVREAIDASIAPGFATGSPGAAQFGTYARAHRAFMSNHHMKVYALGEEGVPSPAHFPVGTIIVFSKGRCGADPNWGHVEIIINSSVACSDHCRKRSDKTCGPDTIILPQK